MTIQRYFIIFLCSVLLIASYGSEAAQVRAHLRQAKKVTLAKHNVKSQKLAKGLKSKNIKLAKGGLSGAKILHRLALAQKAAAQKASARRVNYSPTLATPTFDESFDEALDNDGVLQLASSKALVINQLTGEVMYAKNVGEIAPIASVTKLMTAMVVLDARLDMDELLTISEEDVDYLKGSSSKLRVGTELTREDMLQLALMASENRAAAVLGHAYPGGMIAFVGAMNAKAKMLGMKNSTFVDSSGLNSDNVSTAEDLAKMVNAAHQYETIRRMTTQTAYEVPVAGMINNAHFVNTNGLVRGGEWNIGLSKTGYISEAGRCLVMQAEISGQPLIIVLLDSYGKKSRIGDAQRIRKWIEGSNVKPEISAKNS